MTFKKYKTKRKTKAMDSKRADRMKCSEASAQNVNNYSVEVVLIKQTRD